MIDDQEGDEPAARHRVFELPPARAAESAAENWLRAAREHQVVHDYDTVDRDLERLGMTISRLPSEAGVVWRLTLPQGEQVEAWEPGNAGLSLPGEITRLIAGVVGGKELLPSAPVSADPGAARLRELLETQRRLLLVHDPGVRLGSRPGERSSTPRGGTSQPHVSPRDACLRRPELASKPDAAVSSPE